MSEEIEEKQEQVMEDSFPAYWESHPIHGKGFAPDVIEQFMLFAQDNWNASRLDMAMRYSDLMLAVQSEHEGETRHETARRFITEREKADAEVKARHAGLAIVPK